MFARMYWTIEIVSLLRWVWPKAVILRISSYVVVATPSCVCSGWFRGTEKAFPSSYRPFQSLAGCCSC
jgi:hypothetical protein